ncbi:MAG: tetratricopeptide repeat protein, partial [Anaerolineaceae bacterium]|nr:tetratricopeptide repeat protein [Anaerolineaceae bacterium]
MNEMINPYIAGAPVTEASMFFGRDDVFEWIQRSLMGQFVNHILVVHGQRRVGKTSVLKQLGNRLPVEYIPVFFDLQGRTHTTLDRFLWWLAREITRVLKQDRGIVVPKPDSEAFSQDIEFFENQFLPGIREYISGHILLLTFDEFDTLGEEAIRESLARPLIDHLRRLMGMQGLCFIFSIGSSGQKLENMQASYTEFFKAALYKEISFLGKEETAGLITKPVEGLLRYDRKAVNRIYGITSGHAYFTQLVCHEVFARCQKTGQRSITEVEVEAVLDDVIERGTVNLKFVWDEANDLQKWALAGLANMEGKTETSHLVKYLKDQRVRFSEAELQSALLHLRDKDVLTHNNQFVIDLMRIWLTKNRPIERVREELVEINPIANHYINLGQEFMDRNDHEKAITNFQQALSVNPENLRAQVNIGLVLLNQKAFAKAIREFERALEIDDEDISARGALCDAHLALGDQSFARNRLRQAIESYDKVLEINSEHTEARQRMADILRQRAEQHLSSGREDESLNALKEALAYTPEDESLIKHHQELLEQKKAKIIADLLTKAKKAEGVKNWGQVFELFKQALEVSQEDQRIQRLVQEAKDRQHAERIKSLLDQADQARQSRQWDNAIAFLEDVLELEPDREDIKNEIGAVRQEEHAFHLGATLSRVQEARAGKRWDEAIYALEEVLELEPGNDDFRNQIKIIREEEHAALMAAMLSKAQKARANGQWDQAVRHYREAMKLEPENRSLEAEIVSVLEEQRKARLEAILARANQASQSNRWEETIEALEEYLHLEPDDVEIQDRLAGERAAWRKAQLDMLRTRASIQTRAENWDEALALWGEYLQLEPDDREATETEIMSLEKSKLLATTYVDAKAAHSEKRYDQAIRLLKEIIILDETYKDASRLLAQVIDLRRSGKQFWRSSWLWIGIGIIFVLVVGFLLTGPLLSLMGTLSRAAGTSTITPMTPIHTRSPNYPFFHVFVNTRRVDGEQWALGTDVSMTIDDDDNPGNGVLYEDTQTVGTAPWSSEATQVEFQLPSFDIQPGHIVTLTDGITTITHTVLKVAMTSVDPESDQVQGTADPGEDVRIAIFNVCCYDIELTADVSGHWIADFTGLYDLVPGTQIGAEVKDAEGNGTFFEWNIPSPTGEITAPPTATDQFFNVFVNTDRVEGERWTLGTDVSMTIDDDNDPGNGVLYQDTQAVGIAPWSS